MVFTDTIRYIGADKIPIISMALDPPSNRLATLSQDNQIKLWRTIDLYKWEEILRSGIEEAQYRNNPVGFKPLCVIQGLHPEAITNVLKFSKLKHTIKYHEDRGKRSTSKSPIPVRSKMFPEKKIKVNMITSGQKGDLKEEKSINDYFIATGTDHGTISFLKNTSQKDRWLKFYEFRIDNLVPIVDLEWNMSDEYLAVATLSQQVKIYKLQLDNTLGNSLVKTIWSYGSHIHQVLWKPKDPYTVVVYEKEKFSVWNVEVEDAMGVYHLTVEEETKTTKKVPTIKKEDPDSPELYEWTEDDIVDYAFGFKFQTSWILNETNIVVWGGKDLSKNTYEGKRSTRGSLKAEGRFKNFLFLDIEDMVCFKVSPEVCADPERKKHSFIGLAYNKKDMSLLAIREEEGKVHTEIVIRIKNMNKNFVDFLWLDAFRVLGLDEMGRLHMICLEDFEISKLV